MRLADVFTGVQPVEYEKFEDFIIFLQIVKQLNIVSQNARFQKIMFFLTSLNGHLTHYITRQFYTIYML